jgi:phosphoglycerol transferase MdoB-like AlkP superfamily enzyme
MTGNRYRSLYVLWLIVILFSSITRTVLLLKALPHLELTPLLVAKIYGVGFLFDCVTFSYAAIPFVLAVILLPDRMFKSRACRAFAYLILFLVSYLMLFEMVAEYVFFDEFATRFNFIAVDYLIYTSEVIDNIRQSYPVNLILGAICLVNIPIFLVFKKHLRPAFSSGSRLRSRLIFGAPMLLLPVLSLLCVDLSLAHVSKNNIADELAANGLYSFVAAFRNNDLDYRKFYFEKDNKVVLNRLRRLLGAKESASVGGDRYSVTRTVAHSGRERRCNVVVVVEESLSAEYLGAFGNPLQLTPNLDRLADQGLFFTHLYAVGTRTVRGLEAIVLAVPPLPGSSVIKRPANENFFSWGSVMKEKGYDNKFIYGGRGYFDNMNYFFANNGFATVDRGNFASDEVSFENAWGVCDEDLFKKVIQEGDKSAEAGKPFFSVVMTTSNHRPFTIPAGKVQVHPKLEQLGGRSHAVKYADYAIGKLLAEAKEHTWFKDTIFVIVADHCASSARKMALPVKDYEIPLFIYAPGIVKPQRVDRMMSQIDIAPTVLGLLNFSYTTKFLGQDVLKGEGEERAFISTYQKLGFIKGDELLVLGPKKEVSYYRFNRKNGRTTEIKPDDQLLLDGLGYYQGGNYVYENRINRLSNKELAVSHAKE